MIKRKPVVEDVLKTIPQTRDDDRLLEEHVWMRYGIQQIITNGKRYWLLPVSRTHIPTSDVITRMRRKIQEGGQYLPNSIEVRRKRLKYSKTVLSELGYNTGR